MTRTHATIKLRMLAALGDAEPTEIAVIDVPLDATPLPDGEPGMQLSIRRPALRRLIRKFGRVFAGTI
ncbi:hypothetical protein [Microbacterium saperdae]|uniref:Uncharacterized protein n=1 Tax=Microbacterium saperdae TaxID=69368 RepID=A0A543BQX1_9MICO|nr:hypothetical protein [Microbacterium saperdae]TQL87225.1 hypothetical protein FB560_2892 [Microbacterium saperdae]GGM41962.1 hypothetical protein GCM10010489_11250 [Microbacterium saperdae]